MSTNSQLSVTLAASLALVASAGGCTDPDPEGFEWITMRDGTRLAAAAHVPDDAGPFPTVLVRTPYGRDAENFLVKRYLPRGVAVVIQDTRGRYDSEGQDGAFTTDGVGELQDGYDTCAWIVEQPWSNGTIVGTGGSALGINQYLAAAAGCPGLVAISAELATPNVYSDAVFQNGVRRYALSHGFLEMQDNLAFERHFDEHAFEDDFWDPVQTGDRFSEVEVAGVHIGGWYDIFQRGTIDAFVGYQHAGGEGARGKQYLVLGPWAHNEPVLPAAGGLAFPEQADGPPFGDAGSIAGALLGHYLGRPDGELELQGIPTVNYYLMGDVDDPDAPGNVWKSADDWPIPAAPVRWHLASGGKLEETCPEDLQATTNYTFDPADPTPTLCGNNMVISAGPCDHRPVEPRADNVVFETAPLDAAIEITGRLRAHLYVDLDQPDTDLMVRLTDVYPDGRSMLIADGAQRLAARNSSESLDLVDPGTIVEVDVDLWSTAIVVNRGHRIRVSVTSSNWPRFSVNANNGLPYPHGVDGEQRVANISLHHDAAHASYIELPEPGRSRDAFTQCAPL